MWTGAYEGLVGWRYLLRPKRRPQVLIAGVIILALGVLLFWFGQSQQEVAGEAFSVLTSGREQDNTPAVLMGAGGAVCALGFCLTLFGALNTFLTAFSAFSAFMVTIGVAEVIVVLGVMNGFQADLRSKIIDAHAHIVVAPREPGEWLTDYASLALKARSVEGVIGASPYITAEVMFTSPTNLQAAVLQGIDIRTVGQANTLPDNIKRGSLESLENPELVERARMRRSESLEADLERAEELLREELDRRGPPTPAPPPAPAVEEDPPAEHGADLEALGMGIPAPRRDKPEAAPGLLLGVELRRNLEIREGETMNVVSPMSEELGPNGPAPKSRPFRLAGWFETGMLEFDTKYAYASMAAVQRFAGVGDVAGGIQIRVADLDDARAVRDRLRAALGDGVKVSDWQELNRNLFSALKLEKVAMFLVLSINILLAAFSITSTLVMTIIERRREVAILSTMGASSRSVVRIFMAQGAFTGIVGSIIGSTVGLSAGYALKTLGLPMDAQVYYISTIPVDVRVADVLAIVGVALLISLVSTLYPALYASRLRPVEGLSGD